MSWWRDWNNDNEFEFEVDIDKEFEIKLDFEFDIEYDLDVEIEKKIDVDADIDQDVDLDGNLALVTANVDVVNDPKAHDSNNNNSEAPEVQVVAATDLFGALSQGGFTSHDVVVIGQATADSSFTIPYTDIALPAKTGTFTELDLTVEIFPHGSNTTIIMQSATDTDIV